MIKLGSAVEKIKFSFCVCEPYSVNADLAILVVNNSVNDDSNNSSWPSLFWVFLSLRQIHGLLLSASYSMKKVIETMKPSRKGRSSEIRQT